MRIDFYKFQCFSIGYPYDVCKRTLAEAKKAYKQMKYKGYRLNSAIYGCTRADDSIFLSFTLWYEDEFCFGRPTLTYMGEKYLK